MSDTIKVTAYMEITYRVPKEFTVDRQELIEWSKTDKWECPEDTILGFLNSDEEVLWDFPIVDHRLHEVTTAELVDVSLHSDETGEE